MSGQVGSVQHIGKSKLAKPCDWCGEVIEVGQPAVRWLYKDGGEVIPTRVHPECYDNGVCELGVGEEWSVPSFSRGCLCERGACDCKKIKPDGGQVVPPGSGVASDAAAEGKEAGSTPASGDSWLI